MFVPNRTCRVKLGKGVSDLYGQPKSANRAWSVERCSVVHLRVSSEKSSVRADSSASRGNAMEAVGDLKILFTAKSKIGMDDIIEINAQKFRVTGIEPRFNVVGQIDHIEIVAAIWRGA